MKTLYINTVRGKAFFLSSLTEQEKDILYEAKDKSKEALADCSEVLGIYCPGITKLGYTQTASLGALTPLVGHFKGRDTGNIKGVASRVGQNREIHFRDYSKTQKEQQKTAWIVNTYQDTAPSAKSAFKQMDEKYCCIWEVSIDSTYYKEFMEKLGKDKWILKH